MAMISHPTRNAPIEAPAMEGVLGERGLTSSIIYRAPATSVGPRPRIHEKRIWRDGRRADRAI